jgi:hypothetical protein
MGMPYFGGEDTDFSADTVEESMTTTSMAGNGTLLNQATGREGWGTSPTKCLVVLWFAVLAAYWAIGFFFKSQRA